LLAFTSLLLSPLFTLATLLPGRTAVFSGLVSVQPATTPKSAFMKLLADDFFSLEEEEAASQARMQPRRPLRMTKSRTGKSRLRSRDCGLLLRSTAAREINPPAGRMPAGGCGSRPGPLPTARLLLRSLKEHQSTARLAFRKSGSALERL
jgi:hypothetical protein